MYQNSLQTLSVGWKTITLWVLVFASSSPSMGLAQGGIGRVPVFADSLFDATDFTFDRSDVCQFAESTPRALDQGIRIYMLRAKSRAMENPERQRADSLTRLRTLFSAEGETRGGIAGPFQFTRDRFRIASEDTFFEIQLTCDSSLESLHVMIVDGDELSYVKWQGVQNGVSEIAVGQVATRRNGSISAVSMMEVLPESESAMRAISLFGMWWNHVSE